MATKKKAMKQKKSELLFVLDGKIFIEERLGKKVVSKEEIDGKLVLGALVRIIEGYLDNLK